MVPIWLLSIIRHLVFRGPQKGTTILTTTRIDAVPVLTLIIPGQGLQNLTVDELQASDSA